MLQTLSINVEHLKAQPSLKKKTNVSTRHTKKRCTTPKVSPSWKQTLLLAIEFPTFTRRNIKGKPLCIGNKQELMNKNELDLNEQGLLLSTPGPETFQCQTHMLFWMPRKTLWATHKLKRQFGRNSLFKRLTSHL